LSDSEIKNLSNTRITSGYDGSYNFTYDGTNKYYYVVYPDSWGDFSNWKDTDSGFTVDSTKVGTVDVTNDFGVVITYVVWRTTYQQGGDLNSIIE
jgi:hypothetical protein